jgi:hypothetical protein
VALQSDYDGPEDELIEIADGARDCIASSRLGCTSLGMMATSAHDKDPLLERQKSPNRNAGISAHRRRFAAEP